MTEDNKLDLLSNEQVDAIVLAALETGEKTVDQVQAILDEANGARAIWVAWRNVINRNLDVDLIDGEITFILNAKGRRQAEADRDRR